MIEFIKNVWAYRDILWHDRDWDRFYMFRMFERKLRRMAKHFMDHDIHPNRFSIAKQISIAAECCRRLHEDKYEDLMYEAHDRKWGDLILGTKDDSYPEPRVAAVTLTFNRTKVTNEEEHKLERAESERIWKHADYMRQQDLARLSEIIRRQSLYWWC